MYWAEFLMWHPNLSGGQSSQIYVPVAGELIKIANTEKNMQSSIIKRKKSKKEETSFSRMIFTSADVKDWWISKLSKKKISIIFNQGSSDIWGKVMQLPRFQGAFVQAVSPLSSSFGCSCYGPQLDCTSTGSLRPGSSSGENQLKIYAKRTKDPSSCRVVLGSLLTQEHGLICRAKAS